MAPHAERTLWPQSYPKLKAQIVKLVIQRIVSFSSLGQTANRSMAFLTGTLLLLTVNWEVVASARAQPWQARGKPENGRQGNRGIRVLEKEKPVKRDLAAHQAHSYIVELTVGQYVCFIVHQRGIDVEVTLFDPDGKQLSRVFSSNRTREPEPVSIIAEISGNYRLEVRSTKTAAGSYELKIEELRKATGQDKSRIAAEQTFMQAELLRGQGTVESLESAILMYEKAVLLSRAAEDRIREAKVLNNIGELYDVLGEKQKALKYFAQVLPLRRALNDREGEARTEIGISQVYTELGEIQKAFDSLEIALHLSRATADLGSEAAVLTAFGSHHVSLGDSRKALDFYFRALTLWRAAGDRAGEAKALSGLAKAYIFRFQARRALHYHKQALTLQRILGDRRGEAHTLHNISWTYYTLGKKHEAHDYNSQALSLMKAVGDRRGEAAIYTNLGWISELSGESQKALDYYHQALPLMATGDWEGEANTLYRLANVERDLNHLPKARAYIESALAITESLRATVANRKLRASYAAFIQQYHEFYIDLFFRLHQHSPSEGYDVAALEASERARARGLLELLAEADVDIRNGVDLALLEQERNLQRFITAKTDRQIRMLNSKHTEQQASEAKNELAELVSSYHDLEAKIRIASPHYAALVQAQTLTLPQIQQLLNDDTVLLEYALGESRSFLWMVTSSSIESFALEKRSVIEDAARRVYELLTARTKKIRQESGRRKEERIAKADVDYYLAASELSRLLLAPVVSQLGKKRLLIVSDWALQHIPFAALPHPPGSTAGEGSAADNYKPLILDHEIINLPSASTLGLLRRYQEGRKLGLKTVAVFADPVFEASDNRVSQQESSIRAAFKQPKSKALSTKAHLENVGNAGNDDDKLRAIRDYLRRTGLVEGEHPLPRLSYSRKEAMAIASLVPESEREIVLDFDVNYRMITDPQLGEYRFLHFATHAWLDTKEPELSGILLSLVDKEGRPQESGILRLGDVYNMNLPVELVTLSACETALGRSIKGEGMVGLTRGFMYAGAPRVLASLWKVDDVATADLMKLFYEGMLGPQRLRPAAALREAQKQMHLENRQGSPFYWAGFVLQGDWR